MNNQPYFELQKLDRVFRNVDQRAIVKRHDEDKQTLIAISDIHPSQTCIEELEVCVKALNELYQSRG